MLFRSNLRTMHLAFADHFKIDACSKHNLEYDRIFVKKDYESRKILQITGTEEAIASKADNPKLSFSDVKRNKSAL